MRKSGFIKSIFFAFTFLMVGIIHAQKEPHFELFNISSGLSTMEVTSLFQDSQGFLWLGAVGAVNRYNGYEFEKIKLDTSANGQLGNFQNFGFYEDDRGWIWINSDKGLFKYDPETNLSERFQFHEGSGTEQDFVLGECQLSDSILLVAAGFPEESLYRLNIFTGFKKPVKLAGQKIITPNDLNIISKMVVTDPGKVWIFHFKYGLLLYTINTGFFTQILPIDKAGNEFHFSRVTSIIHKPGESDYWIGDAKGVYKYNLKTNKIQKYLNLDYPKVGNPVNLYNNFALDKDNNIWMSARNYGLYVIRNEDEKVIYFPPNPENLNFLTDKFVDDIIIDKFNIMWLANSSRGLLKYDMSREPIHLLKNEPNNKNSLIGSYIFSISEDPLNSNVFIIGSNEAGLNIFDKNKDIIKRYTANPKDPKSISMNSIRTSYRMPNGEYWLGTWGQ
jgi:ligand-binding sensor domain-containing protein